MVDKKHKPIFDIKDRGFRVRAWYLKEKSSKVQSNALVKITKDNGKLYRRFRWPAYKIFNIAAHFEDIVDGELEKTNDKLSGYRIAGSMF